MARALIYLSESRAQHDEWLDFGMLKSRLKTGQQLYVRSSDQMMNFIVIQVVQEQEHIIKRENFPGVTNCHRNV